MQLRATRVLTGWLPRGEQIDEAAFRERHRILTWFLAAHLPLLAAFGLWLDQPPGHVAVELAAPLVLTLLARSSRLPRRWLGMCTTAGLVYVSAVIVHFSGGTIEAHFHFFIIVGFIALYQDWATFAWAIGFTLLSHGVMGTLDPRAMYNHEAAINGPWKWALIHAAAVGVAAIGQLLHWRFAEIERERTTRLSASLVDEQTAHRASLAQLYVNLARRNHSLLSRQVEAIDVLEASEADPETLERLFRLDHVTTRLRRHTESLLVLAGQQTARASGGPAPLRDVVRASAGEVEHYQRVDVRVQDAVAISGHVVPDVTHLIAELVENALTFSPPETTVVVGTHQVQGGHVVVIEDRGIGMGSEALAAANRKLHEVVALTDAVDPQLGMHVVARLAARHGIRVRLQPGRGAGTIAMVFLPARLQPGQGTEVNRPRAGAARNGSRQPRPAATPRPSLPATPPPTRPRPAVHANGHSAMPANGNQSVPGRVMFTAQAAGTATAPTQSPSTQTPPTQSPSTQSPSTQSPPVSPPSVPTSPPTSAPDPGPPPGPDPTAPPASARSAASPDTPRAQESTAPAPTALPTRVPGRSGPGTAGTVTGAFDDAGRGQAAGDLESRSRRLSAFQAGTAAGRSSTEGPPEGSR